MCRNQLVEYPEEEMDSDEESDDNDSDTDSEDGDGDGEPIIDEPEIKVNLDQLAAKMGNMGYTMADMIKYMSNYLEIQLKPSTADAKYTDEFFDKLAVDIDDILDGTNALWMRDDRSYANVAKMAIITETETETESTTV